jgi:hypothetical protein
MRSVPIPKGVSMVRASIWLDSPASRGTAFERRCDPLGLYLSEQLSHPPDAGVGFRRRLQLVRDFDATAIEITGAPYDPMRIYLDDLVMEPVDPNGLRSQTGSGLWSNNSLRPSNFTSPTSPLLLFLAASPMQRARGECRAFSRRVVAGVEPRPCCSWRSGTPLKAVELDGSCQSPLPDRSIRFAAQLIEFDVANNVLRLSNVIHSQDVLTRGTDPDP